MQVTRLTLKEFGSSDAPVPAIAKKPSPFLPGGRFKGEVPPPPPVPSFTEEQLKSAERDAYKKGFVEGTNEGVKQTQNEQADVERRLSETAEKFVGMLTPIFEDYRNLVLLMRDQMPRIALAIAQKAAGNALASNAQAMIEDVATRCVEAMITEPKLTITVNTALAPALEKRLKDLASRMQAATDITVVPSADIAEADCRIEWKNGAFARDTKQLWEQVDKVVGSMIASALHEAKITLEALQSKLENYESQQPNEPNQPKE